MVTNHTQIDVAERATLTLPDHEVSAADKKEVARIADGIDRTDAALEELLRYSSKESAQAVLCAWANGKGALPEAILAATLVADQGQDVVAKLRSSAKTCRRELLVEGSRYVAAALLSKADAADKVGAKLEARERKEAESVNVVFSPSLTLQSVRKTAAQVRKRAEELAAGSQAIGKNELRNLL